jgi:hypothetical protein
MTHQSPADPPPKPAQFVAVDQSIMQGARHIATAISATMAKRIARALNLHQPNERGV